MDFLDPKKKRAHKKRLTIGYFLISIAIICVTAIVALMVYGYTYNPETGKIVQNGLVFVDSKPVSARLNVGGQDKGQTAVRLLLPESSYTFLLTRDGYRDWKTTVDIRGGNIERLIYALLFPVKLVPKDAKIFNTTPTLVSQTPNHKNLLVLRSANGGSFEIYDLTSKSLTSRQLTTPTALVSSSTKKSSWQVVEWSGDSRKVLLKHNYGSASEYIIMDINKLTKSVNLNKLLSPEIVNDVHLHDGNVDQFYYRNKTNQLKLVNVGNKRVALTLNNIAAYKPAGADEIAYVISPKSKTSQANFGVYKAGLHTIHSLPYSQSYFVDIANFDGHWYAAAGAAADHKVYVYSDPVQQLTAVPDKVLVPITVLKSLHTPTSLSFAPNQGVISLQSASSFAVYDIQAARLHTYDTKLKLSTSQMANWLDAYHLYALSQGKMNVWDFNGDNLQALMPASRSLPLVLAPDDKSLLSFGPSTSSKSKLALKQTSLLLTNN